MKNKVIIRREILQKRDALSDCERTKKSELICQRLMTDKRFIAAETILVYMPIKSEVSTIRLIEKAWTLNKRVGLPKIQGDEMNFYECRDFSELSLGAFNILEPKTEVLIEQSHALLIMPGVVFDQHKHRIGYGKGFYDRYLKNHPNLETIALAFDCQIIDYFEAEAHDIAPNFILTESHTI